MKDPPPAKYWVSSGEHIRIAKTSVLLPVCGYSGVASVGFQSTPQAVNDLCNTKRVLCIHGPAGIGKTMLLQLDRIDETLAAEDKGVGPILRIVMGSRDSDDSREDMPVLHIRFWMSDEAYQGICGVQTRIFLHIIETILSTPRLRAIVGVHHNPKMWAALDIYGSPNKGTTPGSLGWSG